MLDVTMTEQEKKDMAVIYGFLVDVWMAQKTKNVEVITAHAQGHRNVRIINNTKTTA